MAGYTKNDDGGYSVNYEDQRFVDVEKEQVQKEAQINQTYDNIINNSDKYYQDQINATEEYKKTQTELQQAQTDFAIQQIEQQKEQAHKDYIKEQKASYVDYMKQKASSGVEALNSGMSSTGYSESSIVAIYNQYQNRVSSAKESLNQSILNYNNSIQQATMANNEKLAEIAFNALQTQTQLNREAFEYKNSMMLEKENALQQASEVYYARYQDVLNQINNEIDLQMAVDQIDREYEQWLAEFEERNRQQDEQNRQWWANFNAEQEQWNAQLDQWNREMALKERESAASIAYTNAQIEALKAQDNLNDTENNAKENKTYTIEEILSRVKRVQGANVSKPVKDGISGKTFATIDDLLNYYGYAAMD